jgi:hypothetical protein
VEEEEGDSEHLLHLRSGSFELSEGIKAQPINLHLTMEVGNDETSVLRDKSEELEEGFAEGFSGSLHHQLLHGRSNKPKYIGRTGFLLLNGADRLVISNQLITNTQDIDHLLL